MNKILNRSIILLSALFLVAPVLAEVLTFGGDDEQFKGDGDLVPPECTMNVPRIASEAFFVMWDCTDNESPKDELRSELWIKPKGENISRKVKDFLGFPASIEVNEGLLKTLSETEKTEEDSKATSISFSDYLPVEVRLIVRDRAGVGAISEVRTVVGGSSLLCDISIKTQSSPASGDSTGVPSLAASATSVESANSGGGLQSLNEFTFSTCEIDQICKDDSAYSFSVSEAGDFTLIGGDYSYTGTGELTTDDSGSSTYTGSVSTSDSGSLNVEIACK